MIQNFKKVLSKIFVVFVAMSQVLPTSTLSTYAEETSSHKLTVQVVGEANVTVSTSDDVSYSATADEEMVQEFEDGTELKFNILSDNGITSINEDGVALTDSQGQALKDYENNTDYDFSYTTKDADKTVVITVKDDETTVDTKTEEKKESSDKEEESKEDSKEDKTSKSNKSSTVHVTAYGYGDVTVSNTGKDDNVSYGIDAVSQLNTTFKVGQKLKIDITTDNSIVEIDADGEAIEGDYAGKTTYSFEYEVPEEESSIDILFAEGVEETMANMISTISGGSSIAEYLGVNVSGEALANYGKAWQGKFAYSFGSSPASGLDCSGFVTMVVRKALGTIDWIPWGSANGKWDTNLHPYGADTWLDKYGLGAPGLFPVESWQTWLNARGISNKVYNSSQVANTNFDNEGLNIGDIVIYYFDENGTNLGNSSAGMYPHIAIYIGNNQVVHSTVISGFGSAIDRNGPSISNIHDAMQKGTHTLSSIRVYSFEASKGYAKIKKTSANKSITDNNSCYSLKGAVYGIYSDKNCSNQVGTLTTDENGDSNTVELKKGTYYVKETTAPKGYARDEDTHTVTIEADKTTTISLTDIPQSDPIGIIVGKVDAYTNKNKPQGSASLENAQFTVKYYGKTYTESQIKSGEADKDAKANNITTRTWVLKTDSDGFCNLSPDYLVSGSDFYYNLQGQVTVPIGTISIQETKAPTGYQKDDTIYVRNITAEGHTEWVNTYNAPTINEESYYGSFQLTKFFTDASQSEVVTPEVGAKFVAVLESYYNEAGKDINKALELAKTNGSDREYSEITTDSDGVGKSGKLVYGTYIVVQTSTGTNATETYEVAPFRFVVSNQNGQPYVYGKLDNGTEISASSDGTVHYLINNKPVQSGVKIVKKDAKSGKTVTLNNASFKIKKLDKDGNIVANYSKATLKTDANGYISMKVGTKWYDTFVTNADNRLSFVDNVTNLFGTTYEANASEEKGSVALPIALDYGYYQIEETNAPKGYLLTNNGKFQISKSNITGTDDDGQPLINIVMSDETPKGKVTLKKKFNSSKRMHGSVKFNLVATEDIKDASDGSIIYSNGEVVGTYTLDESNDTITVSDLPLQDGKASYKFVEVSTYENYKLNTNEYPFSFEIKDQTTKTYTAEVEVENEIITIKTKAINAKTNEKEFNASSEIYVTDIVSYDGLVKGKEYTMYATLVDKETGKAVTDKEGNVVEGFKRFTATGVSGDVKVKLTLNSSKLGGKDYVVYETLYNTSEEGHEGCAIASHKDITDGDQTITVLDTKIHTTAKSTNGTHEQQVVDGKLTLTDTVTYENLVPKQKYRLSGVLMNKATNSPLLDAEGKEVKAKTEFTPTSKNGTVDVTFKFDASKITAGTETVVFETLYEIDTDTEGVTKIIEVTDHKDINDEGQSIDFIDIHTTAKADNGTHEQQKLDKITLTDTVSYEGLKVGKEYTVKGTLMNKATSFALTDKNGKEITAETTFTPKTANGTVDVVFTFDGSLVKTNDSIVAYESLERKGIEIATHTDITDKDQTVDIIDIHTTAKADNGTHEQQKLDKITLTDTVSYEGLKVGKEYTVKGTLMNAKTGKAFTDKDGKKLTSKATFTPKTTDGTVDVVFTFDGSIVKANDSIVVFEDLVRNDVTIATHSDLKDKDQTIDIIDIHTTAKADNGTHEQQKLDKITLTDTVSYEGLKVGKEYTVKGTLMNKETGEAIVDEEGNKITSETTFTPETTDGTVDVVFTFDGSLVETNDSIVVFENLERNNIQIATHSDIEDESQEVDIIDIHTTAVSDNGTHEQQKLDEITLTDTVAYEGLKVGKEYTVKGTLMNQKTGEAWLDEDGNKITSETTFTPETTDGTVDVVFTFDGSIVQANDSIVVFEDLVRNDVTIATHSDIDDKDQTVDIIDIHTTALADNGTHEQQKLDEITLTDTVAYEGLKVGKEYTVKGTLMNKETGEAIVDEEGHKITSETTFTPETTDGTVDVVFTFDGSLVETNESIVVFENLERNKIQIATHSDIEDKDQTVDIIDIHTTALSDNETHEQQLKDEITLTDTVAYEGLKVGKEYTVKGTLMNKETGEAIVDEEGNEITSETTFTPETTDGTVDVVFTFDGSAVKAGIDIVVFEDLVRNDVTIATHSDIKDEGQTVDIIDIHTTALSEKDNHTALAGEDITITDTVKYENLVVGKEYTVKGVLMDKETGKALLDADGKEITSETTFTPEEKDGEVDVVFTLDSSALAGKTTVVFEDLYRDDVKVATHSDIEDEDQSITFKDYEIQVNKVDSITKKNITSKDFEFTMYKDKDCKEAVKTVSGNTEKGTATFSVTKGTWYIKETKAPQGYKLSKEVVKVEVKDDKMYVNDKEVDTDSDYLYSFIYQDALLPSIKKVKTGSENGMTMYAVTGLVALCLFAIVYFLKRRNAKSMK